MKNVPIAILSTVAMTLSLHASAQAPSPTLVCKIEIIDPFTGTDIETPVEGIVVPEIISGNEEQSEKPATVILPNLKQKLRVTYYKTSLSRDMHALQLMVVTPDPVSPEKDADLISMASINGITIDKGGAAIQSLSTASSNVLNTAVMYIAFCAQK